MPDQRDEVLNFIKYNGPVLPVQIAKHINTNILFSSAILSELVSRKMLKITHASIGGSPLYYLSGQEEKMDERLSKSLGGREKEAYQLLKQKKVLREKDLEPWQRVAIKSITDFAFPIVVKEGEDIETFWKHLLVTDEEAKLIVSETMDDLYKKQQQVQEMVSQINEEELVVQEVEQEQVIQKPLQTQQTRFVNQPIVSPKPIEITTNVQEVVEHVKREQIQENLVKEVQQSKPRIERKEIKTDTKFYARVLDFIKDNEVEILKEEIVKKDKEIDFVVNLQSSFGKLRYLIKAKNKAVINEADVSMAFSEGQMKKMPVILLTNGKLNKKATLLVEQKMQGQLIFKEV